MVELKYQSKRIGDMAEAEVSAWVDALLLKINVITGWVNPADETLNILQDQFRKKLLEDYPQLNVDEIEYAFRSKGTIIEDWGKTMNLNLIDKVLIPYVEKRYDLAKVEERKAPAPVQKIYTEEELLNQKRFDIEMMYQRLRKGQKPYKIPDYFEEVLRNDKHLWEGETVELFFVRKLNNGAECLYENSK